MKFFATHRLIRASGVAAVLVMGAVLLGRIELLVVAVPFCLLVAYGFRRDAALDGLRFDVAVTPTSVVEGEPVSVTLTISTDTPVEELEYVVPVPAAFRVTSGDIHKVVTLAAEGIRKEEISLEARRWGVYRVGRIGIRVTAPGRLMRTEDTYDLSKTIRVYPVVEPVRSRPRPPQTQVFSGNYVARAPGEGIEFAAVRAYAPGDSVRHVNWRVTSRRNELFVNQFHPERNADVMFLIDSFAEVGPEPRTSLDLAVRSTAALARHYLRFKDRVGLVTFGGVTGWLECTMGEMHVHRVVDYLLKVGVFPSYAWQDIAYLPSGIFPPLSMVVVFTPLVDERAVGAIFSLASRQHTLVVIDTLDESWVEPQPGPEGEIAYRAWLLKREALRFRMRSSGIPVVGWTGKEPLEVVLASLPPALTSARRM